MRDAKGRFLPGNPYRFDTDRAKAAYQLSVEKLMMQGMGELRARKLVWRRISGQWDGVKRQPWEDRGSCGRAKRRGGRMSDGAGY